ncbi:MAG: ABC transporter permease [Eubacteriales bacterium]
MSSLYPNTVNEVQKIFQRKKYIVFLVITALIPIMAAFTFNLFQSKLGIFAVNSASFPILMLWLFTGFLWPLFIFSVASDIFSGELGEKTLKIALTRPISRFYVFLSKNISIGIFILINLCVVFIVSVAAGLFLEGTSNMVTGLWQNMLAYITAMFPMLFLSIEAVFLAQFFRSSGGALATCIFVFLAAKIVPFLSSTLAKINPFAYTDWYMMWLGSSVSAGRILNVFLILLSYSVILFASGFYMFDKRDL